MAVLAMELHSELSITLSTRTELIDGLQPTLEESCFLTPKRMPLSLSSTASRRRARTSTSTDEQRTLTSE